MLGCCELPLSAEVVVSFAEVVDGAAEVDFSVEEVAEREVFSFDAKAEYAPVEDNNTAIESINTSTLSVTRFFITKTSTMIITAVYLPPLLHGLRFIPHFLALF